MRLTVAVVITVSPLCTAGFAFSFQSECLALCDQCRLLIFANCSNLHLPEMSQKYISVEQIHHSHFPVWNLVALYTYNYEWISSIFILYCLHLNCRSASRQGAEHITYIFIASNLDLKEVIWADTSGPIVTFVLFDWHFQHLSFVNVSFLILWHIIIV